VLIGVLGLYRKLWFVLLLHSGINPGRSDQPLDSNHGAGVTGQTVFTLTDGLKLKASVVAGSYICWKNWRRLFFLMQQCLCFIKLSTLPI